MDCATTVGDGVGVNVGGGIDADVDATAGVGEIKGSTVTGTDRFFP